MTDTTITKVSSSFSPRGAMGQRYLASGRRLAMRLWENEMPGPDMPASQREYETIGFVLQGRAELNLEGQTILLGPGDCWVVPKDARHSYHILEPFTAIEATSPPAQVHSRDE